MAAVKQLLESASADYKKHLVRLAGVFQLRPAPDPELELRQLELGELKQRLRQMMNEIATLDLQIRNRSRVNLVQPATIRESEDEIDYQLPN